MSWNLDDHISIYSQATRIKHEIMCGYRILHYSCSNTTKQGPSVQRHEPLKDIFFHSNSHIPLQPSLVRPFCPQHSPFLLSFYLYSILLLKVSHQWPFYSLLASIDALSQTYKNKIQSPDSHSLDCLTEDNFLQFCPFVCNFPDFVFLYN